MGSPATTAHAKGGRITELDQLTMTSSTSLQSVKGEEIHFDGGLLERASGDDLGGTLHLKGAIPHSQGIVTALHCTLVKCKIWRRPLLYSFGIEVF